MLYADGTMLIWVSAQNSNSPKLKMTRLERTLNLITSSEVLKINKKKHFLFLQLKYMYATSILATIILMSNWQIQSVKSLNYKQQQQHGTTVQQSFLCGFNKTLLTAFISRKLSDNWLSLHSQNHRQYYRQALMFLIISHTSIMSKISIAMFFSFRQQATV